MKIPVVAKVLKANDEVAGHVRRRLAECGVPCVNLMGSAGCGKTSLLEATLRALAGELRIGVIAGDLATTRDAERIAAIAPDVVQINTGGSCHLEAQQVRQGIDSLPLEEIDLLVVENVGNLICPVGFDLGQGAKVGMMSVPEGDDKPGKHPMIILSCDLLLLSKTDLLPYVPFRLDSFRGDVRAIREDLPMIELSAVTNEGMAEWIDWLRAFAAGSPPD